MTTHSAVFLFILIVASGFFSYNAQRLVRYLRVGTPETRTDDLPRRIWNTVTIGIAQTKILRDRVAGPLHAAVFWGFVVLSIGTLEILVQGIVPGFSYA